MTNRNEQDKEGGFRDEQGGRANNPERRPQGQSQENDRHRQGAGQRESNQRGQGGSRDQQMQNSERDRPGWTSEDEDGETAPERDQGDQAR